MTSPTTLSVVIPTYRAAEMTTRAARSLLPPPAGCELIVVVDGSGDGTDVRLRQALQGAQVIALTENRGFGGAVNAGFRAAAGEFLATLNNDAGASWADLLGLVEFLRSHPGAGAVAPAIVDESGRPAEVAFRFPRTVWSKLLGGSEALRARREPRAVRPGSSPRPAEYLKGACVVFRREALRQVGTFDEQFWMFAEEIDLFRRLHADGWQAWVAPAHAIVHGGGRSTRNHPDRTQSSRFRQQSYRSICRYHAKHHGIAARLWLRLELGVRLLGRLLAEAARVSVGRGDSWWLGEHLRCLGVLLRPWPSRPREGRL